MGVALRKELLATANRGESSAIFWTSDGLHVLGGVIINGTSKVPDKNFGDKITPPRNAAYIFAAVGSAPHVTQFSDIAAPSRYVQCYDHLEYMQQIDPKVPQFTTINYCGYGDQANMGGRPAGGCNVGDQCGSSIATSDLKRVVAEICDTTRLLATIPPARDTFGACN